MSTEFVWTPEKLEKLRARIAAQPKVFSILEEPLLASLACCRGIQFELNTPLNRLPEFFGLEEGLPWDSKIVRGDHGYEIEFWPTNTAELKITQEKLIDVLSPKSLNDDGRLHKLIVSPLQVALSLKAKGVDLVIVRDWILASGLATNPNHAIYYVKANPWELRNNVGYQQCELLANFQLPFFGTHDMVDHVAGSTRAGLLKSHPTILDVYKTMKAAFAHRVPTEQDLTFSYLLSLLLDDLGQPLWHGSALHEKAMIQVLNVWEESRCFTVSPGSTTTVPESFFKIMEPIRKGHEWNEIAAEIDALKSIWQSPSLAV